MNALENSTTALPTEEVISPEGLEVARTYLRTLDLEETADILHLEMADINKIMNSKAVRQYVGYQMSSLAFREMDTVATHLQTMVDRKLEELEEAEAGSSKDIADLLTLQHKMIKEQLELKIKLEESRERNQPSQQNNTQINIGQNYQDLLDKILKVPNARD